VRYVGWEDMDHDFDECRELSGLLHEPYKDVQARMKYVPYSCCWSCGLPCDVCVNYHAGRTCRDPDRVVTPAALAAFHMEDFHRVETWAGRKFQDMKDYMAWLCSLSRKRVLGKQASNSYAVLVFLVVSSN
jgi:hypothetical protein